MRWMLLALVLAPPLPAQCGDCDGNGVINVLDAFHAARHDAGIIVIVSPQFEVCNVQGTPGLAPPAIVNILDALEIARHAAGLIPGGLSCGTAPACTVSTPGPSPLTGTVIVDYQAEDLFSTPVDLTVEFSTDGALTFATATVGVGGDPLTGLSTSPSPGDPHTYAWDTVADGVGSVVLQTAILRLTVSHAVGASSCETLGFDVNNAGWLPCATPGLGMSLATNPGFETGDMSGWVAGVYQITTDSHDGTYAAEGQDNNPLILQFTPVPCTQVTALNYWAKHPTTSVFGVTWLEYTDGTHTNVIHNPWYDWTYFDLLGQLDPTKILDEIWFWGYSGGGAPDITIFDSFEICASSP